MPPAIVPVAEPLPPAAGALAAQGGSALRDSAPANSPPAEVSSATPLEGVAAVVRGKGAAPGGIAPRTDRLAPESLHPALWRGHQLGRQADHAVPTGFADLDAQLPGGGWPRRALSELMLAHDGLGEIRLLAPALAAVQRAGRLVMLFDPPARLSGWALAEMGLAVEHLLLIQSATQVPLNLASPRSGGARAVASPARLWALEQALKSGHVGAVLAWLPPRLAPDRVRRLQLAAQAHDGPAFVLREAAAQGQPSAAPLRLGLRAAGVDHLAINVLKRRGPPLLQPVHLRLPSMLSALPAAVAGRPASGPPRDAAVTSPGGLSARASSPASSGAAAGAAAGVAVGMEAPASAAAPSPEASFERAPASVPTGPGPTAADAMSPRLMPATFVNLA